MRTTLPAGLAVALLLSVAVLAAGCAAPARTDQMAIGAGAAGVATVPAALRGSLAIRDVTGGGETNPMWMSKVGSAEFARALEDSLRAVGMLAPNQQASRFLLVAHLEKLDQPMLGLDMTVTATVSYQVFERATGRDVFRRQLATPHTATVKDAFIGTERLRLANEGAIRANIMRLIDEVSRLSLDGAVLHRM